MAKKFFFHLRNGETFVEDTIGISTRDLDSAHRQGTRAIKEMLIEKHATKAFVDEQAIEECDEDGHMFFSLSFNSLLPDSSQYSTGRSASSFYFPACEQDNVSELGWR